MRPSDIVRQNRLDSRPCLFSGVANPSDVCQVFLIFPSHKLLPLIVWYCAIFLRSKFVRWIGSVGWLLVLECCCCFDWGCSYIRSDNYSRIQWWGNLYCSFLCSGNFWGEFRIECFLFLFFLSYLANALQMIKCLWSMGILSWAWCCIWHKNCHDTSFRNIRNLIELNVCVFWLRNGWQKEVPHRL